MAYQQGKIYEIVSGGKRYIGSTTEKRLERRLQKHIYNKRAFEKGNREWTSSYELIDKPDCQINLLELYPCNNRLELREREKHYITTLQCINKVIPNQTMDEWRERNKDKVKEHYERRKVKVKCECGKEITKSNMWRHLKTHATA